MTPGLFLADMLFKGMLLMGAAYAAARALKRLPAATRHAAWALAFLGLLLLPFASVFLPQWKLPLRIPWQMPGEVAAVSTSSVETEPPATSSQPDVMPPAKQAPARGTRSDLAEERAGVGSGPEEVPLSFWLIGIWAAGALLLIGRLVVGLVHMGMLSRSARPARGWEEVLMQAKRRLGVSRSVRLLVQRRIEMPRTMGALRPVILLPAGAKEWPDEKKRLILLHELAHVRRWDYASHLVALLARALHWPNPLAWTAARRLLIEREQACDDEVVQGGRLAPSEYARSLLEVARGMLKEDHPAGGALAMAHQRSELKSRIESVLDADRSHASLTMKGGLAMTVALVICLSLLGATHPVLSASTDAAPTPTIAQSTQRVRDSLSRGEDAARKDTLGPAATQGATELAGQETEQKKKTKSVAREKTGQSPEERASKANEKRGRERLAQADTSQKERIQMQAVRALSALPDDEAVPRLMRIAQSHSNEEVRSFALTALAKREQERVTAFFRSFIQHEKNVALLERAVRALGYRSSEGAVTALIDIARDHPSQRVREAAIFELARRSDSRALSLLVDVARSGGSRQARLNAIKGLAKREHPQAIETLAELAKAEGDPAIGVWAAKGLNQIGSEEAVRQLIEIARSPGSADVREHAIRAISDESRPAAVLDALIEIATTAEEPEVQMAAIQGIGRRGNGKAADALMDILDE